MLVYYEISVGKQELLKELEALWKLSSCCDAVIKNSLKAWLGSVEVGLTLYLTQLKAVLSCMDGFFVLSPSFLF